MQRELRPSFWQLRPSGDFVRIVHTHGLLLVAYVGAHLSQPLQTLGYQFFLESAALERLPGAAAPAAHATSKLRKKVKRRKRVPEAELQRCVEGLVAEFENKPLPDRDERWDKAKERLPTLTVDQWRDAERRFAPQWQRARGRPRN